MGKDWQSPLPALDAEINEARAAAETATQFAKAAAEDRVGLGSARRGFSAGRAPCILKSPMHQDSASEEFRVI